MKKINVFVAILAIVFFVVSCGKDDAPTTNVELKDDPSESLPIGLSILENGISIKGGKKIEGMPPPPSGTVDFKLDSKTPMGVQKAGFDAEFTSSSNIAGAYVLVQTTSGEKAKSYFDIPVDSLKKKNFIAGRLFKSAKKINAKSLESNEFKADFDFTENVPPGEFCYEICVYDADGNVSAIEEECINVQAWGGNPSIVGEWVFDRLDPKEEDELYTLNCDNGQTKQVEYDIYTLEYYEFVLQADGGYYEIYDEKYKPLNIEESKASCSAIYGEEENDKTKYIGKWAYNVEENTISIIDFYYEDLLDSKYNEVYPEGDVYFSDTKITVVGDELHISDEEGKIIYKRK